jgi:hypothetical protein
VTYDAEAGWLLRARSTVIGLQVMASTSAKRAKGHSNGHPEVFLHVGQHKTGTSSIQAVLFKRRRDLLKQGVHVLRWGQSPGGGHHRLVRWINAGAPDGLAADILRSEMTAAFPSRVVISSEAANKMIVLGRGDKLVEVLKRAGAMHIHLVLYMRSPFGLANAFYSHDTGSLTGGGVNLFEYVRTFNESPGFHYHRYLELASRSDVTLTVRPYGAELRGSVVADFLELLGADLLLPEEPTLNQSFGPVALQAMRRIAQEVGPLSERDRQRLRARLHPIARSLAENPFWGIEPRHEQLLAGADRSSDEFARAVWGRTWRDMIGEERPRATRFDPLDPLQRDLYHETLSKMRDAKRRLVNSEMSAVR